MSQNAKPDFSPPYRYPFLIGVYMATNAIPDAYTIVDGPDCLFFKAEFIHGKHDINSTLLDVFGNHRIALTGVNAASVVKSRGDAVTRRIQKVDALPNSSVIFVSSLPMVTVIGTQYDSLIREAQPNTMARLIECPNRSLQGDWLTGYSDILDVLAASVDIGGGIPDPKKVAIIGYLMERNEGDHIGNVKELERLCAGIGLELVTVWLGGQPYAQLSEVKNAGTLIAFPLGRKAAKIVAQRTGAQVLEADVPFGLGCTHKMLLQLARATGHVNEAEKLIKSELERLIPKLEWIVPRVFIGKRLMFSASPDLFRGFLQIAQDIGAEVVHLSAPVSGTHWSEDLAKEYSPAPPILFEPKGMAIASEAERLQRAKVDLVICNTRLYQAMGASIGAPYIEFGFPSNFCHFLTESPFLGFEGYLCFLERMANAIMMTYNDRFKAKIENTPPGMIEAHALSG